MLVLAIVIGTSHHFLLDVLAGAVCVAIAWIAARRVHGPVPRGRPAAGPAVIALAGIVFAGAAYGVNAALLGVVA